MSILSGFHGNAPVWPPRRQGAGHDDFLFCIPLFYGCIGKVLAFGIFGSEEAAEIIIQFIVLLSLMLGTGWSIRKRCFSAF